jgi:S-adenosylmethionine:tRNA ribosyltransferase-isomerase|nr:tRNA preQ1(34) S-adenosylmethionine ribosyltransferase-isomerase QueA [Kofleriaceae bacterium]
MPAPADYRYDLPPDLIAQHPAPTRDGSRLLHVRGDGGLDDLAFPDLVDLVPRDAVIVANDTRVIPARVLGTKATGGNVELLFLEPEPDGTWRCLARARRPLRAGQLVTVGEHAVEIRSERAGDGSVTVRTPIDTLAFLDRYGRVPLPRYVERAPDAADAERYQTMFAREPGAVAAPTAGLHMTPAIADRLRARGCELATLTLHVGWGTFAPIRADDLRDHRMHRERFAIPARTLELVASGRPVVAIGTTTLRALEAHAAGDRDGTELFVYPGSGHAFRVVTHLVTNFHLPESTLLMLVCAFAGTERALAAYRHAVAQRYRFYSYGDAMLVHRC